MAITFSQSSSTANIAPANPFLKKFGSANGAGNAIVVGASWGAANNTGIKVTDTAGNSYVTVHTVADATNGQSSGLWYAANVAAASVNTVQLATNGNGFCALAIHEYSGITTTNASDGTNAVSAAVTAVSAGTINATVDRELIFGWAVNTAGTGTFAVKGSATTRESDNGGTVVNFSSSESIIPTATRTNAFWTLSAAQNAIAIVLGLEADNSGLTGSQRTFFCDNPLQSGSSSLRLNPTQPGASTSTTGWTVGKTAAANYSRVTTTIEKAATTFGATAQPSGSPLNSAEDCFRISASTQGEISAGTWYSSFSLIAVTSGGVQDGNARFRLWKSANADGTAATELTAGAMVGTTVTNLSTTVAQSSSASTWIGPISLSNEYLFQQAAWQITGAGGATTNDVLIRIGSFGRVDGSGLLTSTFSDTGGGAAAAPIAGMLMAYYENLVQGLV